MKYVLCAVLAAATQCPVFALDPVESIPLAKCDVKTIVWQLHAIDIEVQGRLAVAGQEHLREIEAVSAKATKPNAPVGDQLSRPDILRFEQARQRLISNGMRGLIESRRDRDADVINQLVQVADKNYRYETEVPPGHSDYIFQEILNMFRAAQQLSPRSPVIRTPLTARCSFDLALYSVEVEGVDRINKTDMTPLNAMLRDFQARYKMDKIDRGRLSPADKSTYDEIVQTLINPYRRAERFVDDLENIRILTNASQLVYESDKSDLEFSGGDGSKVGKTVSEIVAKEKKDILVILALSLLRGKIDQERPSKAYLDLMEQARVVNEINLKHPPSVEK